MSTGAAWADVDQLVDELRELGDLRGPSEPLSVDVDASKVRAPGVWVMVRGFRPTRLQGMTYKLTLHLLAPDTEHRRALDLLAQLYTHVADYVDQLGGHENDARVVVVQMPDGTRLPSLALDVELDTTDN